jgi:hypothetical protein
MTPRRLLLEDEFIPFGDTQPIPAAVVLDPNFPPVAEELPARHCSDGGFTRHGWEISSPGNESIWRVGHFSFFPCRMNH